MESLLASSSSTGAQRRSYLAVSISERQAVTNKSLSLSSMLSFNRKEWILFFRKGESGDLRTTSCNVVFLIFPIHTTFQSEIIKKWLNSNKYFFNGVFLFSTVNRTDSD